MQVIALNTATIALIPIAVATNLAGGVAANLIKLPLFLDSVGTILVGVLAGPVAGALTGILSNLVGGIIIDPIWVWYTPTAACIGLIAGFFGRAGLGKRPLWFSVACGVTIAVAASMVSAPITTYVFGGFAASGQAVVTGFIAATGRNLIESVFASAMLTNLFDKVISVVLTQTIVQRLPKRMVSLFPAVKP